MQVFLTPGLPWSSLERERAVDHGGRRPFEAKPQYLKLKKRAFFVI